VIDHYVEDDADGVRLAALLEIVRGVDQVD
jgi:hypothetical protein